MRALRRVTSDYGQLFAAYKSMLAVLMLAMPAALSARAQAQKAEGGDLRAPIVVTAKRYGPAIPDAELTERVEQRLQNDPFLFADHVTVTAHDGVVTLRGVVTDVWDLLTLLRSARKIPGVRRVINDTELSLAGD